MSTNPGATIAPVASMSRPLGSVIDDSMATMRSPAIATSAR
jgi:hypothetical protein